MAPWFVARQPSAVGVRFARCLNRIDDAAVPGAATDMAIERLGHRAPIRRASLVDERRGADDDAGNAEAALDAAFEDERVANRAAQLFGQSFDRDDVAAFHLLGFAQTGQRRVAVDHHEAAAAAAFGRAAVLRRHDAELLAQHLEEVHARLVGGLDRLSV